MNKAKRCRGLLYYSRLKPFVKDAQKINLSKIFQFLLIPIQIINIRFYSFAKVLLTNH